MGRFASDIATLLGGTQRRQIVTLTASKPSVPIPSWARIARITGCGAGGGGGNNLEAGQRGGGGGAGGYCVALPLLISGQSTISVVIGAPGVGAAGSSGGTGTNGGSTKVTLGAVELTLEGGKGGQTLIGGSGGRAYIGDMTSVNATQWTPPIGNSSAADPRARGADGGQGDNLGSGAYGIGGCSPFGGGGAGGGPVTANAPGGNATGHGAGGAGGNGTGKGGDGSPGFVIIEFEEAL